MQQCPVCDGIYDESEYSKCPYCNGELGHSRGSGEPQLFLFDKKKNRNRWVSKSEFEKDPDRYENQR